MEINKKDNIIIQIMLVIGTVIVFTIINYNLYPLVQNVGGDEFSTIAISAFLWGEEWENVLISSKYYGFGYSIFLTPILKITDNPLYIYRFMQLVNSIINAGCVLICYKIMLKLLGKKEIGYCLLTSLAIAFLPGKFNYVINEHMIILLIWLSIYLLILLHERDNKILYTVYLVLLLAYSLTVHTRMILLMVIISGYIIALFLKEKKKMVNFPIYFLGIFVGIALSNNVLIKNIQNKIWLQKKSNTPLANTSGDLIEKIFSRVEELTSINSIKFILMTMTSQITTGNLLTVGILFVSIVSAVALCTLFFLKKAKIDYDIIAISWICLFGVIFSVLGQAIIWLPHFEKLSIEEINNAIVGGRAKVYLRYYFCYVGPLIMLFFVALKKNNYLTYLKKYSWMFLLLFSLVAKYILYKVYTNFNEFKIDSSPTYGFFYPFGKLIGEEYLTQEVFGIMILITFTIFILMLVCLKKKKHTLLVSLVVVSFFTHYYFFNYTYNSPNSKEVFERNIGFYDIVKDVEKYGKLPKDIYLIDGEKSDVKLQFFLSNYSIIINYEEIDFDKVLITQYEENIPDDCKVINIDSGGYICLKNEELIQLFEKAGY